MGQLPMREMERGANGPDVARWERFLLARGHLARVGAGIFDEVTEAGTRKYQTASSISETGRADAQTLARGLIEGFIDSNLDEKKSAIDEVKKRTDWTVLIPILIAIFGGLVTASVAVFNARSDAQKTLTVERERLRSSIILQAIRTDDSAKSLANLRFFAQLGFIDLDDAQIQRLEREPNSVPVRPAEGQRRLSLEDQRALLPRSAVRVVDPATGSVELDDAWVSENIISIEVPQLRGKRTPWGEPFSGGLRFHRRAAPALLAAFAEIEQRGLLGDVVSFDGAFVPRTARGRSAVLSPHALGIAIDINAANNPFRRPPLPAGEPGSVLRLVPIFERHGFYWGGRSQQPDAMQFEFADRSRLFSTD